MSELLTRDFGTRDAERRPLSVAVTVMGREADHNLYIVFLCGSGSYFGSGKANVIETEKKRAFLIVFD